MTVFHIVTKLLYKHWLKKFWYIF